VSKVVIGLNDIQDIISARLKPLGFRKKGRSYNRIVADGIVQVIGLQSGMFPIGDSIVPGPRENLYGKFTVNLGVYLPCIPDPDKLHVGLRFFAEYHCRIRSRLGNLINDGSDVWWAIEPPFNVVGGLVAGLIEAKGIPFLNDFGSYERTVAFYERNSKLPFNTDGASALTAAFVYKAIGDVKASMDAFDTAKRFARDRPVSGFMEHIEKMERPSHDSG